MWLLFFMSTFSSSQIWCKQGVASLIAKHLKVKFAMTRRQGIRNGQSSKKSSDREVRLFGVQLTEGMMRKSISMGNLSHFTGNGNQASTIEHSESGAMADGYLSDGIVQASGNVRERRKGVPWTEKEHRLFLIGLQKLGKGDWRGIAKNFVTTRNATQVASHAQKYFLRQSNLSRRKKRSSLFDIIPESEANFPEDTKVNLADMSSPLSQLSLEQGSGVLSTDYMEHTQFPALQFPIPPTTPVPGASCGLASNNHEPVSFFLTVAHGSLAEGENHKDCTVSTTSEAPNVQLSSILPTSAFPEAFSLWDKLFPPPSSSKISTIVKPIATVSSAPLRIDHVLKSPELESDHASIRPSPLSLQLIQPSRISAFHVKSSFRGNSCSGAKLDEAISVL